MKGNNWLQGAIETPPEKPETPSVGNPTDGDGVGQQPTTPGAFWFYKISQELDNFISNSGLTPTDDELDQFWQAANSLLSAVPVGSISFSPGDSVPSGYLKLNGATLSRSSYPALFAYASSQNSYILQATKDSDYEAYAGFFGSGDGSNTFTLPDYRGEFLRMLDDGRGIDSSRDIGTWQSQSTNRPGLQMQTGSTSGDTGATYVQTESGKSKWVVSGRDDGANRYMRVMLEGSPTYPRNLPVLALIKY